MRARAAEARDNPAMNRLKRLITGSAKTINIEKTLKIKTNAVVTPRKQAREINDNARDKMYRETEENLLRSPLE